MRWIYKLCYFFSICLPSLACFTGYINNLILAMQKHRVVFYIDSLQSALKWLKLRVFYSLPAYDIIKYCNFHRLLQAKPFWNERLSGKFLEALLLLSDIWWNIWDVHRGAARWQLLYSLRAQMLLRGVVAPPVVVLITRCHNSTHQFLAFRLGVAIFLSRIQLFL